MDTAIHGWDLSVYLFFKKKKETKWSYPIIVNFRLKMHMGWAQNIKSLLRREKQNVIWTGRKSWLFRRSHTSTQNGIRIAYPHGSHSLMTLGSKGLSANMNSLPVKANKQKGRKESHYGSKKESYSWGYTPSVISPPSLFSIHPYLLPMKLTNERKEDSTTQRPDSVQEPLVADP